MLATAIARDLQPVVLDTPVPNGDCNGFWIGVGGDLDIIMVSGTHVVVTNVGAGYWPGHVKQVNSAGTTATGLLAAYI